MISRVLLTCLLLALTALPVSPAPVAAGDTDPGPRVPSAPQQAFSRSYLPFALTAVPLWSWGGSMLHARQGHTATLLMSGEVLVAGGGSDTAELYDPVTNGWTAAAAMSVARTYHTATLLPSGKVLVAGGETSVSVAPSLASAELYDPETDTWSPAGSMSMERSRHTATLLTTGQVLLAGGWTNKVAPDGGYATTAAADLYDPVTGTWSPTGAMLNHRAEYTATALPSGKVLVAGGRFSSEWPKSPILPVRAQAELYDPETGNWDSAAQMGETRYRHIATLLATGQVLVIGWSSIQAELYDPTGNTWTPAGTLSNRRFGAASLLSSGEVLMAGGSGYAVEDLAAAVLYDPARGVLRNTATLSAPRSGHTMTLLQNGQVLVTGGQHSEKVPALAAELYNPVGTWWGKWVPAGDSGVKRSNHTATLLPSGQVLVTGGRESGRTAELYDPATGAWSATGSMRWPRYDHTATLLPSGKVLVVGGLSKDTDRAAIAPAELYDPVTRVWSSAGILHGPRAGHTATLLPDGRVLVAGGWYDEEYRGYGWASAELYDPAAHTWSVTGSMSVARAFHSATLLSNGDVLVAGGGPRPYEAGYPYASGLARERSAELYHPGSGTWSAAGSMAEWRNDHTATLLGSGKVLVAGRTGSNVDPPLASAELYDPVVNAWTSAGSMRMARDRPAATLLRDGTVLITGGWGYAAERYAEAGNTWMEAGSMAVNRRGHTATLLPSGRVLVAGGSSSVPNAELYDP